MISRDIKKQIIDQTNIVEVVGEVVKLTKKGSSYFGLCPFHNDNNPSMSVNNEKKMFNCFSCNTKGNVIYFMSRFNNITEDQATISLAKRLGIEISEASTKEAIKQERLLKVMTEASNFYQYYLNNTEEGLKAKEYLYNRGINDDMIKLLKIGLSSSERNYLNLALKQKNISELDQVELGLIKVDDNFTNDIFRSRIMFPIENKVGQIVGFSGRIYTQSNQAKYINSSENEIFHKGQILYNFHNAIPYIRQNDKIIIYEGFMDVIASLKVNVNYAVATMGTALTNDHIRMILNLTKNVVLCFDGDDAGINAMKRSAMMFANYGIIPKAIVLPSGMDPDEYLKAYGQDSLISYYTKNEKNVYDWLFQLAKRKFIKGDLVSTENFKKEVFDALRVSKQNTIIEYYIKLLSEEIDISFETLVKDFGNINSQSNDIQIQPKPKYVEVKKNKPVTIKRKVFIAYDKLIKHMISSKDKYFAFYTKFGDDLYLDSSLIIYFDLIKKIGIFYAENEYMDETDFDLITKQMDDANKSKLYTELASKILNNTIANIKDNTEFEQCMNTINECYNDLSSRKLYNKALNSNELDDIKKFENIKKDNVKIMSKED